MPTKRPRGAQRGLGGAPAEIKWSALYPKTMRSGGNNFNYFLESLIYILNQKY